jgi:hypothetical protein
MPQLPKNFETLCEEIVTQGRQLMLATHTDATESQYAGGFVIIRHQPHRRSLLRASTQYGCPFCRDRATDFLIEKSYRGMILSQNLGPYGSKSLILRTRLHHEQDEIISFLDSHGRHWVSDLPAEMTLFCNQFAGNSQRHLHIQYLNRLLPVSRAAEEALPSHWLGWQVTPHHRVDYAVISTPHTLTSDSQDDIRHFMGCFLRGSATTVATATTVYLRKAAKQGYGRFNFAIWQIANSNRFISYIVLRNPETLRTFDSRFPVLVGALTTCGLITEERLPHQMPKFDYPAFVRYIRTKLLPPITPWEANPEKH